MRIAVVNWTNRLLGGAEEYLARIVPQLVERGHTLALWYESDQPSAGKELAFHSVSDAWHVDRVGKEKALEALRWWKPDVIYVNGLADVSLHRTLRAIAPGVLSIHAFAGTCISGNKSHHGRRPCDRRFGASCLAMYFPYRCGGLNPLTMIRAYRTQLAYLQAIREYEAVIVHSKFMQGEYDKHGIATSRVQLPLAPAEPTSPSTSAAHQALRLLYMGRLTRLKGGAILFEALRVFAARTSMPVSLTVAGDGDDRATWERAASNLPSSVTVRFVGWIAEDQRTRLLDETDAIVVPSIWPEPFGMVGLEAAAHGIPAVAFDVGGIHEWLQDGETGAMASGDPPTAVGLAAALERIRSHETRARFGSGARKVYDALSKTDSAGQLLNVLERVAQPTVL